MFNLKAVGFLIGCGLTGFLTYRAFHGGATRDWTYMAIAAGITVVFMVVLRKRPGFIQSVSK